MPSTLAWLDFSSEDQRRAREIVALFTQIESRDELGIGTVRDALSDAMFPGISVIQTRARYFLFVPWLFREAERRGRRGADLVRWMQNQERRLIEALRKGGDENGLIGKQVGASLKIVPSTIYWTGLQRFRILRHGGTAEQVADLVGETPSIDDALTELVDRSDGLWDPTVPASPRGFFEMEVATFVLTPAEADWLTERIVSSVPETLLAWLASSGEEPSEQSQFAWEDPSVQQVSDRIRGVVEHAENFSLVLQGAALLYNLLVAERAHAVGTDPAGEKQEHFREWMKTWAAEVDAHGGALARWDRGSFWALVTSINPRITFPARAFVDRWIDLVMSRTSGLAENETARRLVAARERQQKGSQSRLVNDRLVRQWGGSSGADRLSFRWRQAKLILSDLSEGRRANAGA